MALQSPQDMDAKTENNQVIIATLFICTDGNKKAVMPSSLRYSSVQKAWFRPPGHKSHLRTPLVAAPLRDSSRRAKPLWSETRGRSAPRLAHNLDYVKQLLYKNAKVRPSKDALSGRPAI